MPAQCSVKAARRSRLGSSCIGGEEEGSQPRPARPESEAAASREGAPQPPCPAGADRLHRPLQEGPEPAEQRHGQQPRPSQAGRQGERQGREAPRGGGRGGWSEPAILCPPPDPGPTGEEAPPPQAALPRGPRCGRSARSCRWRRRRP